MTNPAGFVGGRLVLNAPNIWITQGSILTQLEANPNFAGRDAALGTNSGTSNPLGFVGAGGISAFFSNTFFVQNSGISTDMGGITVGDRGMIIDNSNAGTAPPAVTLNIYGRQIRSTGAVVTNAAFASIPTLIGTFAAGSMRVAGRGCESARGAGCFGSAFGGSAMAAPPNSSKPAVAIAKKRIAFSLILRRRRYGNAVSVSLR